MQLSAKTTSKQSTLPVRPETLLDSLAGSVIIPKGFEGLTFGEIIDKAKAEHFDKKLSKMFKEGL